MVVHCRKLEIPNPYSVYDIYKADQRWKKLHENAVPAVVEFENSTGCINDNKNVKKPVLVENTPEDEGDFSF